MAQQTLRLRSTGPVSVLLLLLSAPLLLAVSGGGQDESPLTLRNRAPLWMVSPQLDSLVILNNSLPRPVSTRVVLYDPKGKELGRRDLLLEARETKTVSLAESFSLAGSAAGSLAVFHDRSHHDLGVQVEIVDRFTSALTDVEAFESEDFTSSRLQGVFLQPSSGKSRLIVNNGSDREVEFDSLLNGIPLGSGRIGPKETVSVALNRAAFDPSGVSLVEVDSSGEPGDLLAAIVSESPASGRLEVFSLEDPARLHSARRTTMTLYGTEERSTKVSVLMFNRTENALPVEVTLHSVSPESENSKAVTVPLVVPARSGEKIELSEYADLASDATDWTLDVHWQGPPDALVLTSLSVTSKQTLVNELVDPEGERPRSNNYPVFAGEGLNTRITIKNPDEKRRFFIGHFFFEDGSEYDIGAVGIEPKSLVTIDLEQLQREQPPDGFGNTIAPGPVRGQFVWFPARSPHTLVGRAVVTGLAGEAFSLSCSQCSLGENPGFPFFDPGSATIIVDGLEQSHVFSNFSDMCSGVFLFTSELTSLVSPWSSLNTLVATVGQSGVVAGVAAGGTEIIAHIELERCFCNLSTCTAECETVIHEPPLPTNVYQVTMQVEQGKEFGSGGGFVVRSASRTLTTNLTATVTGPGTPTIDFQWAVGSMLAFVGPSSSSGTSTTMNVSVGGTAASTQVGDTFVKVTATINSAASKMASIRFTVREPKVLSNLGLKGGAGQTTQLSDGYVTTITYFVFDQLGSVIELQGLNITEVLQTSQTSPPGETFIFDPPDGQPKTTQTSSEGKILDLLSAQKSGGLPDGFSATRTQAFTVEGFSLSPQQTINMEQTFATVALDSVSR